MEQQAGSDIVRHPQLVTDVVEIRIERTLGNAEHPEAFEEIIAPVGRDYDLIEHVFVADVFEAPQGIVDRKAGLLGIETQVAVG